LVIGFLAIWGSPLGWNRKLDSGSIVKRVEGSKWEIIIQSVVGITVDNHSDFDNIFLLISAY
jgi:hypothetical protein